MVIPQKKKDQQKWRWVAMRVGDKISQALGNIQLKLLKPWPVRSLIYHKNGDMFHSYVANKPEKVSYVFPNLGPLSDSPTATVACAEKSG